MTERKYIVVHEDGRPMNFDKIYGGHFYYVGPIRKGSRERLKSYTKKEALRLIEQANQVRIVEGAEPIKHHLIRIEA